METGSAIVGPPAPDTLTDSQRRRRDRIVAAALQLLDHRDYEKIQVREVAEAADVALGTVYRYFASKEHLFAAALLQWAGSQHSQLRRRPRPGASAAEALNDLMQRVISAFEHYPQGFRLLIAIEGTPDLHARELYDGLRSAAAQAFREPLEALGPDDQQVVVDVVSAVLGALLRSWVRGALPITEVRGRMARSIDLIFSVPPESSALRNSP